MQRLLRAEAKERSKKKGVHGEPFFPRDCVRRRGWCEGADRATKARSVRAVVLQAAGGAFDGADSGGWLGFEFGVSAFSLQAVFVSADGNMYSSRRN